MRSEVDILISMCRFSVDVELEMAVLLFLDEDVEHRNPAFIFPFHRPLDAGVERVEKVEEGVDVVVPDRSYCVVRLAEPKQDDILGGKICHHYNSPTSILIQSVFFW